MHEISSPDPSARPAARARLINGVINSAPHVSSPAAGVLGEQLCHVQLGWSPWGCAWDEQDHGIPGIPSTSNPSLNGISWKPHGGDGNPSPKSLQSGSISVGNVGAGIWFGFERESDVNLD